MRVLGPLVHSYSIARAAKRILEADVGLIGTYLDEVTRQDRASPSDPVDRVERPGSIRIRHRVASLSDDQLPAIILASTGTVGDMSRDGAGDYRATWALGVTVLTQSTDEQIGAETASILCTAASAVLIQLLPLVDTRIINVTLASEDANDSPADDARSRHACTRELRIAVQDVLNDFAGPVDLSFLDPPIGDPALDTGDRETVLTTGLDAIPVENLP